jgi:hypothetical protein
VSGGVGSDEAAPKKRKTVGASSAPVAASSALVVVGRGGRGGGGGGGGGGARTVAPSPVKVEKTTFKQLIELKDQYIKVNGEASNLLRQINCNAEWDWANNAKTTNLLEKHILDMNQILVQNMFGSALISLPLKQFKKQYDLHAIEVDPLKLL